MSAEGVTLVTMGLFLILSSVAIQPIPKANSCQDTYYHNTILLKIFMFLMAAVLTFPTALLGFLTWNAFKERSEPLFDTLLRGAQTLVTLASVGALVFAGISIDGHISQEGCVKHYEHKGLGRGWLIGLGALGGMSFVVGLMVLFYCGKRVRPVRAL